MGAPLAAAAAKQRRRAAAGLAAGLAAAFALACATGAGPPREGPATKGRADWVRADAPPDYDFLVGLELESEGRRAEALAAFRRALAKDPQDPTLTRKVAELLARDGRLDEALGYAEHALALAPDDPHLRLFVGTLYRLRRDAKGAERVLLGADGQPIALDAALLLYSLYGDLGRLDDALAMAEWVIRKDPENLRGYFAAASVYERMGQPEKAERALRRGLKVQPGSLAIYGALARARRERGDREGEIAIYREALRFHPDQPAILMSLAEAQLALGETEAARETVARLADYRPSDLRSLARLALLELRVRRYDAAIGRLERAREEGSQVDEIDYLLGVVYRRAHRLDDAIRTFEAIAPDSPRYPEARSQLAAIYEARGDYARAIAEVEKARAKKPTQQMDLYLATLRAKAGDLQGALSFLTTRYAGADEDPEFLYALGVIYGESGQQDKALEYMQRVLEKKPDHAGALNYIGYTWAEKGTNLDRAEEMIRRAVELRPDDGFITDSLGWVHYMQARPLIEAGKIEAGRALAEQALRELERANDLTGGDPVIAEHLGDVYRLLGKPEKALEMYREAVSLQPRLKEQPHLQEKLEELRRELGKQ